MPYNEQSKAKFRRSMIKRYGSYQLYLDHMKSIAKSGGSLSRGGGFTGDPERAKAIGSLGGKRKAEKYSESK